MPTPSCIADLFGACAALLLFAANVRQGERTQNRALFSALLLLALLLQLFDAGMWLLAGAAFSGARALLSLSVFLSALGAAAFSGLWLAYADAWMADDPARVTKRLPYYAIPAAVMLLLLCVNCGTGLIYRVDSGAVFHRGALFFCLHVPLPLSCGVAAAGTLMRASRGKDRLTRRKMWRNAAILLVPAAAVLLQYAFAPVALLWPVVTLGLLMVYINVQQRRATERQLAAATERQRYAALENELTQNRVAIMLSQIQPHFLYNALTTIVDLCDTDAGLAKRATIAFSQYLRANMDSLKQERPVPFALERKHIENYLWLEKLRFGDELTVVWDVEATDFLIPALSVQPLVENAVKYGVGKKPGGGTVTIATRETAFVYIVTVVDDGVGFDPAVKAADGRSHVGIDSVRSRLHYQCGGALTIESEIGRGTTAAITILKERHA